MADILYKTITADTQVSSVPCYLVGAELAHATVTTDMKIYDEADNTKTAGERVLTVKVYNGFRHYDSKIFSHPIKCKGIYVDWTAGAGTVYYHM